MKPSVLHLRSTVGMYGAEQMLLGLCMQQGKQHWEPTIAAFAHRGHGRPELLEAAAHASLNWLALPCRGPVDTHCIQRLRGLLAEGGHEVLHCHDYKSIIYGFLATAGMPQARVATLHGWLQDSYRLRMYRWLELRMLRGFDRVCAVSERIEIELREAGLSEARIRRVDNGIDTDRFVPQPAGTVRKTRPARVRLGVAARLSPEKNLAKLVMAVAECRARGRAIELTILGDGPLRADLERLVARLGLQGSVRLPGVTRELERWYPTLDAFVLPSLSEGMPMTVLEALSCGCPVVATAVGAIPELLAGLPDCRTIPPDQQDALVDALMAVPMRSSPRLQARTRIVERYSLARMAERYEKVYAEALRNRAERQHLPIRPAAFEQDDVLAVLPKPRSPRDTPPAEQPGPKPRN